VSRVLDVIERAIPTDRWIADLIAGQQADVVLVTPLVDIGSDQVEYVKAAKALGIRSGLCVHSWDNLTNKGLMRVAPDRVFVWNEAQKHEAVALHGVPPGRVVVTGAQIFDHWFTEQPSRRREEFCRLVGLRPDRPLILYLGSSFFIAPNEAEFVLQWIERIRSSVWARSESVRSSINTHRWESRGLRPGTDTSTTPTFRSQRNWKSNVLSYCYGCFVKLFVIIFRGPEAPLPGSARSARLPSAQPSDSWSQDYSSTTSATPRS